MKNAVCKTCQIRSEIHKAIFGVSFINGQCVPCANETVVFQKGAVNQAIQDTAINASQRARVDITNKPSEWYPEIAEAMRIPH